MATYLTTDSELTAVADAIRAKTGSSQPISYPAGFVDAISGITTEQSDTDLVNYLTGNISTYDNSTITSMRPFAFAHTKLRNIVLSALSIVPSNAFVSCTSLISASLPSCLEVSSYGFSYCASLVTISLPMCQSIGDFGFRHCDWLSSIELPVCSYIGGSAFSWCMRLKYISLPQCVYVSDYAFASCALYSVFFPACEYMGRAFYNCQQLSLVSLPVCSFISSGCFSYCYNLISLYLGYSSVVTLSSSTAFHSTPIGGYSTSAGRYGSIYVPASLLTAYQSDSNWSYFSSRFVGV